MKPTRLRASLALLASAALTTGLVTGVAGSAEAKGLKPATTFTVLPDGSSGKTDKGAQVPNIDSVKATIRDYYGASSAGIANKTSSPYISEIKGLEQQWLSKLPAVDPASKKAVVFDVDDTLLWNYDFEDSATHFDFDPALNTSWVNAERFPAVPGMVDFVRTLVSRHYIVAAVTGRPYNQESATIANLTKVGYTANGTAAGTPLFTDAGPTTNVATKPTSPDDPFGDLPCGTTCTTVQFKSGVREEVDEAPDGDHIVANIGDQWSDLQGGYADASYKMPNPTYYLDSGVTKQAGLYPKTTFTMKPDGSSGKTAGGENIINMDVAKRTVRAYYNATSAGIASKTSSPYISELAKLTKKWKKKLATSCQVAAHRHQKPAVVFDADDTTLWTYDMEDAAMAFNFDPALQNTWVQGKRFPAVPRMVKLEKKVKKSGCTVIGLTGRSKSQGKATLKNLKKVGYEGFTKKHFFFKPNTGKKFPKYLSCKTTCSTIQYKSGTRKYLEKKQHYTIVANLGDQFSDLKGGHADKKVKLPNPTYYLP